MIHGEPSIHPADGPAPNPTPHVGAAHSSSPIA